MSKFNALRFRMSIESMTRLALIAEGVDFHEVYPPDHEHSPEYDEDFVIGTLEEAANVWKTIPKVTMANAQEPEVPTEPDWRR